MNTDQFINRLQAEAHQLMSAAHSLMTTRPGDDISTRKEIAKTADLAAIAVRNAVEKYEP